MAKEQTKLISIDAIKPQQLIEITKWKADQNSIVKNNPFIEITDTSTYTTAKAHRTALKRGRTALLGRNGQEGIIKAAFKNVLNNTVVALNSLAEITDPAYEKQQAEINRYEVVIEERRQERIQKAEEEARLEEQRIIKINDAIETLFQDKRNEIQELSFEKLAYGEELIQELKVKDTTEFEEFEITFYKAIERLETVLVEHTNITTKDEERRLEDIRLTKERAELEEEQRLNNVRLAEEQKKRDEENAKQQKLIDAENVRIAVEKRNIQLEKDKLAEIKRKEQDAIDKKKAIAVEKKRIAVEGKRLKALLPDKEKALLIIDTISFDTSEIENIKDDTVKRTIREFITNITATTNQYKLIVKSLK